MKIGFLSLGCPKNLVDGEVMLGMAREAGHEITSDASNAEVLVVNTCAFIDSAKQESIDAILEMAAQKRDGNCSRLVVTGCLAERYRDELQERDSRDRRRARHRRGAEDPGSDRGSRLGARRLDGSGERWRFPVAVLCRDRRSAAAVPSPEPRTPSPEPPTYIYDAATPRYLTTPKHFAYVKIAEGCDYTCAFCIIPTLRGSYRSRTSESIVAEARQLAERGVRELLLISQDTTFFGIDRGERGALGRLLRELNGIEGLTWIRLLYLYPTTITDDVLAAMADCEKVCRYIDLPLQHASADVLKRMRRPGNRRTYDKLLTPDQSAGPGRHAPDDPHRRVPGRDRRGFCRARGICRRDGLRSRRRVHVFARRRNPSVRAGRRCARPA